MFGGDVVVDLSDVCVIVFVMFDGVWDNVLIDMFGLLIDCFVLVCVFIVCCGVFGV